MHHDIELIEVCVIFKVNCLKFTRMFVVVRYANVSMSSEEFLLDAKNNDIIE